MLSLNNKKKMFINKKMKYDIQVEIVTRNDGFYIKIIKYNYCRH